MGRTARRIERERSDRRKDIERKFRERHPAIARQERGFRKARAEQAKAFDSRDRLKDNGTPETAAKARKVHQGSLSRAYEAGHITIEQLAAAQQIRGVAERIGREVGFGTSSMETRVDQSRSGTGAFFEALGAVRAEVAYRRWCEALKATKAGLSPIAAMVVDELSVTAAAKHWGMRTATARKALSAALDLWGDIVGQAVKEIDEADLLAAHAGLL